MSNKILKLDKPLSSPRSKLPLRVPFTSPHRLASRGPQHLSHALTEGRTIRQSQQEISRQFWNEWLQYRQYLIKLAMRWTSSNMADAEDAVSKLALKAHDRYLRDAPNIRNMRAWLSRLLHNLCMDEHRKTSVRGKIFSQLTPEQYESAALCATAPSRQDHSAAHAQPTRLALDLIMKMPPRLRYPFVLRFVYEYSNSEIAQQLELSEVNVRKRIQLGRSLVRGKLEKSEIY
jgi:RNA polymerase sigma-70 factor (ECF subfamily)